MTDDYVYSAFGEVESSTGSTENPYQWIGREGYYLDPGTARYNLRRREYQANIARFLQQDPLGLEAGDPNLYRYVENDPVNQTDPSGLQGGAVQAPGLLHPSSAGSGTGGATMARGLLHPDSAGASSGGAVLSPGPGFYEGSQTFGAQPASLQSDIHRDVVAGTVAAPEIVNRCRKMKRIAVVAAGIKVLPVKTFL